MKFSLGMLCGFILGAVVAMTYGASAQLSPVDATLGERLHWSQVDQTLRLQRDLEQREHDLADPCRR